jgi:hypothetical protein
MAGDAPAIEKADSRLTRSLGDGKATSEGSAEVGARG